MKNYFPRRFNFIKISASMLIVIALCLTENQVKAQRTNGRNVVFVEFGNNGQKKGEFRQKRVKKWVEVDAQGTKKFTFKEVNRDEWSVYLLDESRGVNIQLDLHTKKVMYSDRSNSQRRSLYNIRKGYSKMNGWSTQTVFFSQGTGRPIGKFVHTNNKTWEEKELPSNKTKFTFKQVARDEWSVYLHDASRKVDIQLDMHTGKVMYKQSHESTNKPIYNISKATF